VSIGTGTIPRHANTNDASRCSICSALVDSAWKTEMSGRQEGTAGWRPEGREPVSETQVAEARVKKSLDDASVNAQMAMTVRTPPTLELACSPARLPVTHAHARSRALEIPAKQDWKFLLGILAVLSVGTALLGHQPSGETYSV